VSTIQILSVEVSKDNVRRLCLIAATYFLLDLVLNRLVLRAEAWEVFWPLNGISIGLLLMRPRREWLSIVLTTQLATAFADYLCGSAPAELPLPAAACALEVVLAALILPPFEDLESWLRAPRLYPRFSLAVLIGPLTNAVAFAVMHVESTVWILQMAPSEVLGVAVMVPLLLSIRALPAQVLRQPRWWAQVLGMLGATALVMTVMFIGGRYPLLFMLYPFLMWVESLLGLFGSSIALAVACILAAAFTQQGYGPFVHAFGPGDSSKLWVELFLAFHQVCFLPVTIMSMERRRLMRELQTALSRATSLAAIDGLTGLANRRTFDGRLQEQWQLAVRKRSPLGVLMIDVDHFKKYNDALGHPAGDECLRAIAKALGSRVRRPTDLVARFGGEEFSVLLPETSIEDTARIAQDIRAAVAELAISHPGGADNTSAGSACVTVSIGYATQVPQAGSRMEDLVAAADKALYLAKTQGRNRACPGRIADTPKARLALQQLRERIRSVKR